MLCVLNGKDDKDPLDLVVLNKLFDDLVDQYDQLRLEQILLINASENLPAN